MVAGAYTQSNWCRQMTAAAKKLGLEVALVLLHGEKGPALQGNLLLDRLMGADVTVVDLDSMERLAPLLEAKAEELERAGRKPYVVAPFSIAEAGAGRDRLRQRRARARRASSTRPGIDPDYVVPVRRQHDARRPRARPQGARPARPAGQHRADPLERGARGRHRPDRQRRGARASGSTSPSPPTRSRTTTSTSASATAWSPTAGREALQLLARTEAVILDPVYSSKAMAGLIDQVRQGRIGKHERVVFVHTGGTPALFAYAQDLGLG